MRIKLTITILVVLAGLMGAACFLFTGSRAQDNQVSLTFQRYSNLDPYVGDVAFLWLTNTSNKSYRLIMTGNSNTLVLDTFTSWHRPKESWLVNCAFQDQTPGDWTNWTQQLSAVRGSNSYLSLGPRSGLVIRVPLPANGQHRKVAVLCEGPATASPFWASSFGYRLFRMLPQPLKNRVIPPQPTLLKV